MLRVLAGDTIEESLLQLGGNRAARTDTDGAVVQFADRGDLGRGTGKERFVRSVDFIAGDAFLDQLDAEFFRQRDNRVARDAFQARGQIGRM